MKFLSIRGFGTTAVVLAAAVVAVVPTPAGWVEQFYSRQVYLVTQRAVTSVSSLVTFSLLDPLVVLGIGGLVWWWWRALCSPFEERRLHTVRRMMINTAAVVAVVYLVFVAAWGLNYRREPLTAKLNYEPDRISSTALADFSVESVGYLNALYAVADSRKWPEFDDLPGRFAPAFTAVQQRLGATRTAIVGRPKRTLFSSYFKRAGIDGMMNPFSLEILVNHAVLPYERPFLVAHEWAHLAGYANEAEASFVGFLVCLSGDVQSQYSAWLFLVPQLIRHIPNDTRVEIYAALDDVPRQHLREIAARLDQTVPLVRRNASRIYDRFLRANRVNDGIASYGLVVDLVLGTDGTTVWRDLMSRDDMIRPAVGDSNVQVGHDGTRWRGKRGRRLSPVRIG